MRRFVVGVPVLEPAGLVDARAEKCGIDDLVVGSRVFGHIDAGRYEETRAFLGIQEQEARWWRDASVLYFQTFAKRPIAADACAPPARTLGDYRAIVSRNVPGGGN